MKMVLS